MVNQTESMLYLFGLICKNKGITEEYDNLSLMIISVFIVNGYRTQFQ